MEICPVLCMSHIAKTFAGTNFHFSPPSHRFQPITHIFLRIRLNLQGLIACNFSIDFWFALPGKMRFRHLQSSSLCSLPDADAVV